MTEDPQWIAFLQWTLPQLRMRWSGFRKVRTQVRKRVHKRLQSPQLADIRTMGVWVASIGGAGTFDGIFLTGIIAVLLT
jgi:hypothetical protein